MSHSNDSLVRRYQNGYTWYDVRMIDVEKEQDVINLVYQKISMGYL